ncbi:MAG: S41 family peptidase, partial [Clostridia bacterium]|nr:S41 family peptidase [Clostridia bacterium]
IVQSYFRLKNGAGWVKVTTDAYYTPNDVCIQDAGITPDYVVEQPEAYRDLSPSMIPHEEDAQLLAALQLLRAAAAAAAA